MSNQREIVRELTEAGMDPEPAAAKQALFDRCITALNGRQPTTAVFAPGRIEVLGKHTDYCGGRSLLCAVDRGFVLAAVARGDSIIRVIETSSGETVEFPASAELSPQAGHWSNYPMTVVRRAARNFGSLGGAEIAIASDLPRSAGLSSSSALVVAMFMVLSELNNLRNRPAYADNLSTLENLAGYLGAIENGGSFEGLSGDRGVGTFGGSQDHTAIVCAHPGQLDQVAFCPVRFEKRVDFPPEYVMAVASSGVVAEKTGQAMQLYNQLSLRVSEILRIWNATQNRNDTTLQSAVTGTGDAPARIRKILADYPKSQSLINRFDQFMKENHTLVPRAAESLAIGDLNRFGEIVDRSQELAERLLGNQTPETILLAKSARQLGAVAASAFGAGFGGSVWAMVRHDSAENFLAAWCQQYLKQFPHRKTNAEFFITRPSIRAVQTRSASRRG